MQRMVLQAASQAGVEVSARQEQGGGDMSKSPGVLPGSQQKELGKPWRSIKGRKGEGGGVKVRTQDQGRMNTTT